MLLRKACEGMEMHGMMRVGKGFEFEDLMIEIFAALTRWTMDTALYIAQGYSPKSKHTPVSIYSNPVYHILSRPDNLNRKASRTPDKSLKQMPNERVLDTRH